MKVAFLFAAYHPNGRVDESDYALMTTVCRLGDIYYYSSNPTTHLDDSRRLSTLCKGWNSGQHNELDFGSWKRIISINNVIDSYDYVFLINNSFVPILDPTDFFKKIINEAPPAYFPFFLDQDYSGPVISVDEYFRRFNVHYRFALFPTFLFGFDMKMFRAEWLQNIFRNVTHQKDRVEFCYKYERGLSLSLIRREIMPSLFDRKVREFSFIYSFEAFNLIKEGFPFIKKKTLVAEFYEIDNLEARISDLQKQLMFPLHSYLKNLNWKQ